MTFSHDDLKTNSINSKNSENSRKYKTVKFSSLYRMWNELKQWQWNYLDCVFAKQRCALDLMRPKPIVELRSLGIVLRNCNCFAIFSSILVQISIYFGAWKQLKVWRKHENFIIFTLCSVFNCLFNWNVR